MKRLARVAALALGGVALIGLVGGDPRGTHSLARSEQIVLAGLALCVVVTFFAWRGARAAAWWLAPTGVVAVMGALSGWIAGCEFAGHTDVAARLASSPGEVAFLVAMTAAGLALPAAGLSAIAGRVSRR